MSKDITGQRFGRLVALYPLGSVKKNILWRCKCDCGGAKDVIVGELNSRNTRSCGCLIAENRVPNSTTHGYTGTAIYGTWCRMKARCKTNVAQPNKHYAGMGIKVCEKWGKFEAFLADMGNQPDGCTIDRIDSTGDYTPENCRWADSYIQSNNRSNNRRIVHDGIDLTVAQWAVETGMRPGTIYARLYHGWSGSDAIMCPVQHTRKKVA